MEQIVTYKTRLVFDSVEDQSLLIEMLKTCRDVFNFLSGIHFSVNESGYLNCKNSIVELHHKCYRETRQKFPSAKSQLVIKCEQSVLSAYRSIKSNKTKIEKPAIKKRLSLQLDKRLFSIKDGVFRITTLQKRIACKPFLFPILQKLLETSSFADPNIFVKDSEVWISLPFKITTKEVKPKLALGVDLGIRRFAATSEGNLFVDKNFNRKKRNLRFRKRCLQSSDSKSARRRLKLLRSKERNRNKDLNYCLSKKILQTKANVIVLENLDLKGLKSKRCRYQNKNRISQVGFAELRRILTYKAALSNKMVVCVNPYYTSQIDSVTGLKRGERKGVRFYAESGLVYDADVNAACNIALRSQLPVSCGNVLDGQAVVNQPIVGGCRSQAREFIRG